jgi:hypothetical protein
MLKKIIKIIKITFILTMLIQTVHAEPWFATGPLLTDSNDFLKVGQSELGLSVDNNINYGIYDSSHSFVKSPRYYAGDLIAEYVYGLSDKFDFYTTLTYTQNKSEGQSYEHLGDTLISSEYKIRKQSSKYNSSLRLRASLILPTGQHQNLKPRLYTTDATGAGSYQPSIGFVFQHRFIFNEENYLNFFASTNLRYAHKVRIHGLSAYGGSNTTSGVIRPGNSLDIILSTELSLTQKLSIVMEGFFYMQQGSTFNGIVSESLDEFLQARQRDAGLHQVGPVRTRVRQIIFNTVMPTIHNLGNSQFIGSNSVAKLTIAPCIEYSITKKMGIIGGAWLSVPGGSNTEAFVTPVLQFVAGW